MDLQVRNACTTVCMCAGACAWLCTYADGVGFEYAWVYKFVFTMCMSECYVHMCISM